ncbi:hypothetical protein KSX31_00060 [Bacteroides stercoris]|nr:hypothetical protein [Bacteroides stercoris]MBV3676026.1 hypothetical protein [Bacteroides stercoris]
MTGVSVSLSITCNRERIGCCSSQQSGVSELKCDSRPMTISESVECECWLWKGCEWVISTPFDVVDVGKRRYACLVRHEERQQA